MVSLVPWLALAVWFIVLFVLEMFIHFRHPPANKTRHTLINGGYFIIGSLFNKLWMWAIVIWSSRFNPLVGKVDFSGRLLVVFLMLDMWIYFWHRMNHEIPFLWRFHKVHHADREMDVTTALRFHVGEFFFSNCFKFMIIFLFGVTVSEFALFELLVTASAFFHHTSLNFGERLDKAISYLVVTPRYHHIHHSELVNETNSNYSTVLSLWDKLFGTYKWKDYKEINIGLEEYKTTPLFKEGLKLPWK